MRLPFGFNLTKQPNRGADNSGNKFLNNLLQRWFYGKEFVDTQDQHSLLAAYHGWVYVCASRNAATFSETPLRLYVAKQVSGQKMKVPTKPITMKQYDYFQSNPKITSLPQFTKATEIEEIIEHPAIDLLHTVNPFMNQTDLMEITDLYEELTGNGYWYVVKNALGIPTEIWPVPPDRMRVVPDLKEFIKEYRFVKPISGYDNGVSLELDEVVHFKYPNPNNQYYGASPLQAIADTYNINQNMNLYENAMFTNNGRPEGFWTVPEDAQLGSDERKRLKTELAETYQGVFNSGKSGLLEGGVKFEKISFAPRELGFLRGREWTKAEIFEAYDTPQGLLSEKANRANADAAQYVYSKFGIRPRHRRFEEKMNEQFAPMFDEKIFFAFDNCVPEDSEYALKEDTELLKSSVITIDEVRGQRALEPIADGAGAIPYIGRGQIPLTAAALGTSQPIPEDEVEDDEEEKLVEMISNDIAERILRQA